MTKGGAGADANAVAGGATPPSGSIVARRPIGVLLLALYDFVAGGFYALVAFEWFAFANFGGRIGTAVAVVVFVVSAARIVAGIGMFGRRGWGRTLHVAVSVPSLLNFPFGTAMAFVSFVYLTRPLVKLWFARSDPEDWSQEERDAWRAAGISTTQPGALVTLLVAGAFTAIAFIGLMAAIVIPNFLNAVDRGKQKRTMADMRAIGRAVESYKVDTGVYPDLKRQWVPVEKLEPSLEPVYIKAIPHKDGWANEMKVRCGGSTYQIASLGKGGVADVEQMEYTHRDRVMTKTIDADVFFADGQFVRYPAGVIALPPGPGHSAE